MFINLCAIIHTFVYMYIYIYTYIHIHICIYIKGYTTRRTSDDNFELFVFVPKKNCLVTVLHDTEQSPI